ncbi:acyltransferase family protein [Mangrovicella endophytica]|uniref:acyltransferase family protein n=1 Tax=Mangrovicella endophytica TaxID=2066697 RepID=UPI000C9E3159|nr:acyltransferase [Mangrovicella endophytica]
MSKSGVPSQGAKVDLSTQSVKAHHRLIGLEAGRFYAAALIVFFHTVRMPKLEVGPYLTFIPNNFGIGVPLFFVISAFGLCIGYSNRLRTADEISTYANRRFFRIAPLFYFMLLYYSVYLYFEFGKTPDVVQIIVSALFIFNVIPQHTGGLVWASWSIGVEMMFYLLLPMILIAVNSLRSAVVFALITIFLAQLWRSGSKDFAGLSANFAQFFILSYLFYFGFGVVLFFLWVRWRGRISEAVANLILVAGIGIVAAVPLFAAHLLSVIVWRMLPYIPSLDQSLPAKLLMATGLSFVVFGLATGGGGFLVNRLTTALGRASFSLYLWHPAIIGLLSDGSRGGLFAKITARTSPEMGLLLCSGLTWAILIPLSLLTFRFIEVPGMNAAKHYDRWRANRSKAAEAGELVRITP